MFWQIINYSTVSYPVPALVRSVTVKKVLEATFFKTLDRELVNSIDESIGLWLDLPESSAPSLLFNAKTHAELIPEKKSPVPQAVSVVNLQISVIHGGSRLSVCSVYFKTSELVMLDVFNQKFAVKDLLGNISVSSFRAELIESSYAGIRQQIIDNFRRNLIPANLIPPEVQANTGTRQYLDRLDI